MRRNYWCLLYVNHAKGSVAIQCQILPRVRLEIDNPRLYINLYHAYSFANTTMIFISLERP